MQYFSKFFLEFSHIEILAPLILLGLFYRPKYFLQPTLLLLFTMVFSSFLKPLFAIPYSEELVKKLGKNGFAFPSGHMQISAVFYGWFLFNLKNNFWKFFLTVIIFGIAFGLIFEGYHNIYDILGSLLFAGLTIFSYRRILGKNSEVNLIILNTFWPAFLLIFLLFFFYQVPLHALIAFELMAVLWFCFGKKLCNFNKSFC